MEIGFTGTRQGMTPAQRKTLLLALQMAKMGSGTFPLYVHHGSCVGADEEFHQIGFTMGLIRCVHPPTDEKLMAPCRGEHRREPKPYLERNKDIVNESTLVIACPAEMTEQARGSGTWSTIRYAQETHKVLLVIFPDGTFDWA